MNQQLSDNIEERAHLFPVSARVREFLLSLGKNPNTIGKEIGMQNTTTIYNVMQLKSEISTSTLQKIVACYKQFNVRWAFTSEGSMLREEIAVPDGLASRIQRLENEFSTFKYDVSRKLTILESSR